MNHISLENVKQTVKVIIENPKMAMTKWSAQVHWKDGVQNAAIIRDFAPIMMDEPEMLGGTNTAPNPVEYLLAAAGSCFAITFEVLTSEHGITLENVEVDVEANLDASVFLGLHDGEGGILNPIIKLKTDTDAPKEQIEEIARAAFLKSPVLASLKPELELTIEKVTGKN